MNQVLFLCTRNICSSRVAEALFKHQVVGNRPPETLNDAVQNSLLHGEPVPQYPRSKNQPEDQKLFPSPDRAENNRACKNSNRQPAIALPDWTADSRGFEVSANLDSPVSHPISHNAVEYLNSKGLNACQRMPRQLEASDLLWSDLIIALNESEHRPLIESRYAAWANRVEYWNVPDFHESNWGRSLARLEANISELVNLLVAQKKMQAYSKN